MKKRGSRQDKRLGGLFSDAELEPRARGDDPLRAIRSIVSEALDALSGEFEALYAGTVRPSIALEMPLRGMLLQAFHSVRSERQLMDRLEFDRCRRAGVGPLLSKDRDQLLDGDIAARFLSMILAQPARRAAPFE